MNYDIQFFPDEHLYLVNGREVPSVTTILNYMSGVEYGEVNKAVLDQAARRGSLVHEYTELMDYDALPDEIEGDIIPYLKAYQKFLKDYRPDWQMVEGVVYNEEYDYIGTVDRYGIIDGKACIVDIKTVSSPTKIQKFTTSAQTTAYEYAIEEDSWDVVDNRYALYLGKDGEYNLVDLWEYDNKYGINTWEIFKTCLYNYQLIQRLKNAKPLKGGKWVERAINRPIDKRNDD